jgi:hypothetical protein
MAADADYSTVIETIRGHMSKGTSMSLTEMKLALQVVQDSVARTSAVLVVTGDEVTALTPLDATACAAGGGTAAAAIVATAVSNLTALAAAPTYVANTRLDG